MKIAITYDEGMIFQHFGKSAQFLIGTAEEKKVTSSQVVSTQGSGHSLLIQFLKELQVNIVVCGGIGQGARDGLEAEGIKVIAGQSGSAEAALHFCANGDLKDNPAGKCNHHHGDNCSNNCGSHSCSSH